MRAARVERPGDLSEALAKLGLADPTPTLVVVGGAGGLGPAELERLEPVVGELAAAAERAGAAVVDGGTDVGVMRLVGRTRARGRAFPLVGVAVDALVGEADDLVDVEPNHGGILLVPGAEWGDEVPWLARVADVLAAGAPSLTVLVDGGEISYADAAASVESGRRVVALAGTGRIADEVAAAARGAPSDERAHRLVESGLVYVVEVREDARGRVAAEVERMLLERS